MTNNFYLNVGYLYDKDGKAQKEITRTKALAITKERVKQMGYCWADLESEKRHRHLTDMRKVVCSYLYDNRWTFPQIGNLLNMDHSSAIYHRRTFNELLQTDNQMQTLWLQFKNTQ
jgi:chromosomal replication initiation ATPase DnaA